MFRFLISFFILTYSPFSFANSLEILSHSRHYTVRIVSIHTHPHLGPLTIDIKHEDRGASLNWIQQERVKKADQPWPEYSIIVRQGLTQSNEIRNSSSMMHPYLIREGFVYLKENNLLWANPNIFTDDKKVYEFHPGFLDTKNHIYFKNKNKLSDKVIAFHALITTFKENLVKLDENISTQQKKAYQNLAENFGVIKFKEKTTRNIVINDQKEEVPVVVWGNDYISYYILSSIENPLILMIDLIDDKIPDGLKNDFSYLEKSLEYVITQIRIENE